MISKAVIPAAGLGTRFYPYTKVIPKEMLPLTKKPVLQFSIDEAKGSGITEVGIIISKAKRFIVNYFKEPFIHFIEQRRPDGLGDAILCSEDFVNSEAFAVLLPDDVILSHPPSLIKLINLFEKYGASIIAVEHVTDVEKYGIVKVEEISDSLFLVRDITEKPKRDKAFSNIGVVGRYVLTPTIFSSLREIKKENLPLELTYGIKELLKKEDVYAYQITGDRFDCGYPEGYVKAFLKIALSGSNKEIKEFVKQIIQRELQ